MSDVITDEKIIDEILTRGVHEIITKSELKEKLMSGKQLHLKLGTDVTGPQLHLGHTVVQRKLRDFQELGHKVTLIIGDFTTLVGDHSDKVDMRNETSSEQIKKDEETYKEQFFKTVLQKQTEIRHNSEWLKKLKFSDVINLAKQFTIAQMLDRETFKHRHSTNSPIGLDEFLYPLMQGYDSVSLKCDVEFGGTDQTFNLLAGRKMMPSFDLTPQCCFITKLLTGSDGRPMGKSLQNFIAVTEDPFNMYGKIMAVVDDVIIEYFELITRVPMQDVKEMEDSMKNGENPMEFKKQLAFEVVKFYHGEKDATKAENHFKNTVQKKELPQMMFEIPNVVPTTALELADRTINSAVSLSELKRIIKQGGFEVNNEKITDPAKNVETKPGDIIKCGKRNFAKIT